MQLPQRIKLTFSSRQAWAFYYLLRVIPGQAARDLRLNLGRVLDRMR